VLDTLPQRDIIPIGCDSGPLSYSDRGLCAGNDYSVSVNPRGKRYRQLNHKDVK